jgi:hypothetical protein
MHTPVDSSNTYQIINCKVTLANVPHAYTNLVNPTATKNSGAKIKPVTFEGCSFFGDARLFFPKKLKGSQPYQSKGEFIFINNTYDNLYLENLNDDLFGKWIIEENKPNGPKGNFKIDIQNEDANFIFEKNKMVGETFTIQGNKGSFIIKENSISNVGKNIFLNNENAVFQNNTLLTGVIVEQNSSR